MLKFIYDQSTPLDACVILIQGGTFGMRIKSIGIALAIAAAVSTQATAGVLIETFVGTIYSGVDTAGAVRDPGGEPFRTILHCNLYVRYGPKSGVRL